MLSLWWCFRVMSMDVVLEISLPSLALPMAVMVQSPSLASRSEPHRRSRVLPRSPHGEGPAATYASTARAERRTTTRVEAPPVVVMVVVPVVGYLSGS